MVEHIAAEIDVLYAPTLHCDGPPGHPEPSTVLFPKLRGRGPPVALPPQQQKKKHNHPSGVLVVVEDQDLLRPIVSLPSLPAPRVPTNRDLRLTTTMEEESRGGREVLSGLRPPALGT